MNANTIVEEIAVATQKTQHSSITGKKPGDFRPGKTRRDSHNGCKARNASNKETRALWQQDSKATNDFKSFPYGTCNGKRNRALKEQRRGSR